MHTHQRTPLWNILPWHYFKSHSQPKNVWRGWLTQRNYNMLGQPSVFPSFWISILSILVEQKPELTTVKSESQTALSPIPRLQCDVEMVLWSKVWKQPLSYSSRNKQVKSQPTHLIKKQQLCPKVENLISDTKITSQENISRTTEGLAPCYI